MAKEAQLPEKTASHDHGTKRLKHASILEEDRISTLPDSILLTILSLFPTKDAIKTGVLSKRWVYLWTSVPSLSFTDTSFENAAAFATAVDDALLLHWAPKLTNFSLEFKDWAYRPELKPRVDLWLRFATTAEVDRLSLCLSSCITPEEYTFPQHLYANEFVSKLNFGNCIIKPNGLIGWSSLKHLYFGYASLPDDVINKVLLGSPRLESLELHKCFHFNRLDIVSESLKKFVMFHSYYGDEGSDENELLELEIVAPKMEFLEIVGELYNVKKCRINDLSALVEVKVDFEIPIEDDIEEDNQTKYCESENVVRELFESLQQVKKLFVGEWCLLELSIMSMKHLPSPLLKCKYLTMKTSMPRCVLPGIDSLLQRSPYVETLVIDVVLHYDLSSHSLESLLSRYDEVNQWKSKEIYFKPLLRCLKIVKIFGFRNIFHRIFILVVQFLLRNAEVLEKMDITEPQVWQTQICNLLHECLQVAQKLLSFPRSSPHAVVMFPMLVKPF
ncbi:putative F-box protein At1g49610 [Castanea sativa]|uniref:putative F-box protein At1g49610 n=1 Tax=Castanea sativa TaxID=21020 RepID=UPI003F651562